MVCADLIFLHRCQTQCGIPASLFSSSSCQLLNTVSSLGCRERKELSLLKTLVIDSRFCILGLFCGRVLSETLRFCLETFHSLYSNRREETQKSFFLQINQPCSDTGSVDQ